MKKYFLILLINIGINTLVFAAQKPVKTPVEQPALEILITLPSPSTNPFDPDGYQNNIIHLQRFSLDIHGNRYENIHTVQYTEGTELLYWPLTRDYDSSSKTPDQIILRNQKHKEQEGQPFPSVFSVDLARRLVEKNKKLLTYYKKDTPIIITIVDPEDILGIHHKKTTHYFFTGTCALLSMAFFAYLCNKR